MPTNENATHNHLLAALPADDYARISSHLTSMPIRARQVLHKRDEPLNHIVFPGRALCSLIVNMEDGASAEVAQVGPEGFLGVEAAIGQRIQPIASSDAIVHAGGDGYAFTMPVDAFRAELAESTAFASVMRGYAQSFLGFVMQSVACNARHAVEARCCRWLLHAADRLGTADLPLTHDLMSMLLGVRRPTITLIMNGLAQAGIVSPSRGMIRITERAMLESRACECYRKAVGFYAGRAASGQPALWRDNMSPPDQSGGDKLVVNAPVL
jgi:CRP-like cAMP-binding protein